MSTKHSEDDDAVLRFEVSGLITHVTYSDGRACFVVSMKAYTDGDKEALDRFAVEFPNSEILRVHTRESDLVVPDGLTHDYVYNFAVPASVSDPMSVVCARLKEMMIGEIPDVIEEEEGEREEEEEESASVVFVEVGEAEVEAANTLAAMHMATGEISGITANDLVKQRENS